MALVKLYQNQQFCLQKMGFHDQIPLITTKNDEEINSKNGFGYLALDQKWALKHLSNWQSELIRDKKTKHAVAKTRSELFNLHYKISAFGKMHVVEPQIPRVVKEIQQMKIKSIILTSRGAILRSDIENELTEVDLEFKSSAIGPEGGYPSTFFPEGIENSREVSYMDGIIMGSGQNKGKLLKSILKKTGLKFNVVIFLDDTLKNIENMENELKDDVELYAFYYTHELGRVGKFNKDKSKANREWRQLRPLSLNLFLVVFKLCQYKAESQN